MKILTVVTIIVAAVMLFNRGDKYSDEVYIKENAFWVENKKDIADFIDVFENADEEFFTQQLIEGKIKFVDKETKISVLNELNDGKIIEIKFLKGKYKNKSGYTLSRFIFDALKEKAKRKDKSYGIKN